MGGLGGREDAELLPADMGGGTRWEEWSRHELGGELEREMRQAVPLIIAREGLVLAQGGNFKWDVISNR